MKRSAQTVFVVLGFMCALIMGEHSQADERVFSEYQYDQVGNEISRRQDKSGAAPSVDAVAPNTVRQNQTLQVTLQGQGLRGAKLGEQNPFFTFSDVSSTNEELRFTLEIAADAEQGPAQVSLSTGLGTAFFSLNVLNELPDLRISPSPLTLVSGEDAAVYVSLSAIDVIDHLVAVSVDDPSIATLNNSQLVFPTGAIGSGTVLDISALTEGSTILRFQSETLGNELYTLRVSSNAYELEPGSNQSFTSQAVGVNKLFTPPPPDLVEQGPIITELRINKLASDPSADEVGFAYANDVGLLKGRYHLQANPKAVGAGANMVSITVAGNGLAAVDDVAISPTDNVLISSVNAAADGQSLSFDISVDADTPLALRELVLRDTVGRIPSSTADSSRLYIGGIAPVIESVSPIYLNRGDVTTVTVRGSNLQTVRGLRFDNNDNLLFSSPTIAADGRSLSFGLEVVGFATLGPRSLTLESLLGDSTALHAAASVINLEDRPPNSITPVVSAQVGVNRLTEVALEPEQNVARSLLVGVSKGSILAGITPNSRAQGSSVTLQLEGQGLNSVIAAEFEPAEGITVGEFAASAEGGSATLDIDIADDAEPFQRRLVLLTDTNALNAVTGADRFTVTLPRPQIESVSPILIDRSQGVVPLTIRGELLNDATSVTVIPPQGVVPSVPISAADGRSVSVSLTVAPDAPLTPRVIQISTPGGTTETAAMIFNTITLVDEIDSIITPITGAQVGVVREVSPEPQTREINALSTRVGIIKQFTPAPEDQTRLAYANQVGISKGATLFGFSPMNLPINTQSQTIEVIGSNLDNVTTVQTIPADGVTLTGPAIISADGTRVTFSATVADDAPQTPRRLELLTAAGKVPFATPQNSQLLITGLEPQLESIAPIQQVRGASFTMTIRGINLVDVQSVQATPANGIQFGTPTVAADGRSLAVQVIIDPAASTEQKVITVTTNSGTTTSAAMPENTFTVISE